VTNVEYLQEFITTTIANLEHVRANGVKKEYSFTVDCSDLDDYNHVDIRESDKFKLIFDELKNASGPTLYWIDVVSDTDTKKIIEALNNYKTSDKPKATPALKSNIDYNSKTLYVGKVKGTFWGRLIQHLGFFKVNATQGLQLFYWTKELSLTLRCNILEFDNNMADTMPIIEYAFAGRLHPLIGKHK